MSNHGILRNAFFISNAFAIRPSAMATYQQGQCNTLQHTSTHCDTLRRAATHCDALRRTATHCDALRRTATHCDILVSNKRSCVMHCLIATPLLYVWVQNLRINKDTATRCNTLRHTAAHYDTLHYDHAGINRDILRTALYISSAFSVRLTPIATYQWGHCDSP